MFSLLLVLATLITVLASVRCAETEQPEQRYADFALGWVDENGDEVNLDSLPESTVIYKTVPEIEKDAVLSFNARNIDVEVFIGEKLVYTVPKTNDVILKALYGRTAGSSIVEIPILHDYGGKTISLKIINPYSNGNACKIVNMYFGDATQIVKRESAIQLGSFCFSLIILFLGIICLGLYIPLDRYDMSDKSMLYLGMAAFAFGMCMITDCKLLHILVGHETLFYTVSQMFMELIPVPLLLFFDRLYGNINKKFTIILSAVSLLDFIVILILNLFKIADYHDNAFLVLLIFVIAIFYITMITIKDIAKGRGVKNKFHNAGVIIIAVSVVLDVLTANSSIFVETSFFTRFGVAGFFTLECAQVLWTFMTNYQKGVKAQLVSRLAYHDGLTDMLNRTSFMEDIEKSVIGRNEDILIAVFDVNNLKYVNDTFGHTCGDELIITAADSISECFSEMGKCYRTGGDEFVLIANYSDAEKKFNEAHENMNEKLKSADSAADYPVSVAAGYAVMNNNINSLKELFNAADDNMYINKKIMKQNSPIASVR